MLHLSCRDLVLAPPEAGPPLNYFIYPHVEMDGKTFKIAQCNNSYIFPGIGLGAIASKATRVTEGMLMASAQALADSAGAGQMLPPLRDVQAVSKKIAFAVGKAAQADGVAARMSDEALRESVEANFWKPVYRSYGVKA